MSAEGRSDRRAGASLSVSAILVAAGMVLSRIAGYIRSTLVARLFGQEEVADAFAAALRIPNFLQNLLGEGVLSASLIPVYAGLLNKEHRAGADRVARAVLGVLALVTLALVVVGLVWASALVTLNTPGFTGEKRELTVRLVQILFPGIGLLVISAWCLAILNSHHKFFLSYVAPVLWNGAIIAALVHFHDAQPDDLPRVAVALAWAAGIGAALQLGVQLPGVWHVMTFRRGPTAIDIGVHVRQVLLASIPVIFTRGVVQISAFIDSVIASYLPENSGAVAALANQQQLYQLPVALFGMAISSAALPTLAMTMHEGLPDAMRRQLFNAQQMIVVLVVPSVIAFLFLGDVMFAMLFQRGQFTAADTQYDWGILAGSSVGLLATTIARLYSNAFYALGDTKTPTRFAVIRVVLVAGLGYALAITVPPLIGIEPKWGAAGLTISAGFAGWVEFALLRRSLQSRIGSLAIPAGLSVKTWIAALTAAGVATALRWFVPAEHLVLRGVLLVGVYGGVYLSLAHLMRLFEVRALFARALRRGRRS
jgi:putative peptidoglycan lipid II flippase